MQNVAFREGGGQQQGCGLDSWIFPTERGLFVGILNENACIADILNKNVENTIQKEEFY